MAVLRPLGPAEKQIVPALTVALKDGDANVRTAAVKFLGDLGEVSRAAGPAIVALLNDKDPTAERVNDLETPGGRI